jgi:DNA (cytosine-5)-methyltransferase 1
MKFVSLFSGAGGLDLGLVRAGWQCSFASDIDSTAVESLASNLSKIEQSDPPVVECADVRTLTARDIFQKTGLRRGDVTLLAGGPPCQSWSSAGRQKGFDDPRGQLLKDYVRLAKELEVEFLIMENVRGLLTARGHDGVPGSALETVRRALLDAGYQTQVRLLNAADFGVAQRRVRLIIIGFRSESPPPFPAPTHQKDASSLLGLEKWIPMKNHLLSPRSLRDDEVILPSAVLAKQLSSLKPGSGVKSPGKKESTRPGGHWGYKQGAFVADTNLAARTITASAQQDWIVDPKHGVRRLCPRECAALQSFPADWKFFGNRAAQYRQIGNAVPPKLAEAIGGALISHVSASSARTPKKKPKDLLPLDVKLRAAIHYTKKEEARNGESRRSQIETASMISQARRRSNAA